MSSDPGPTPTPIPPSLYELAMAQLSQAEPAWLAKPACCCPSRPWFRVLMAPPAAATGSPIDTEAATDLLLCAHHFRISRLRLAELGAVVYDHADELLSPMAWRLGG
jgi:hypothetical protein